METGLILYQSKYGATKKYADWLKEATGFDCMETKRADAKIAAGYDTIILGGGIYASGIAGLSFLKKNGALLKDKRLAVFGVGASPYEEQAWNQILAHNFKDGCKGVPCFYCRGAWDEEAMSLADRTLCRMLQKAVSKKAPEDYEIWEKALMCAAGQKCDWTDRKNLAPVIAFALRGLPKEETGMQKEM